MEFTPQFDRCTEDNDHVSRDIGCNSESTFTGTVYQGLLEEQILTGIACDTELGENQQVHALLMGLSDD